MTEDFALKMMKKLGWQEGKGLGKEEDGRVKPVQVEQKQNVKGIGYGTEGAFAPWWDDLYTKTAVETQIKSKNNNNKKDKNKKKKKKKNKEEKKEKNTRKYEKVKKEKKISENEKKNRKKFKLKLK